MKFLIIFIICQSYLISINNLNFVNACPLQDQCPGANQIYLEPGVAPNCDTECASLCKPCNTVYIQPPFGCYCLPSFARDANNNCIPISKCGTCKLIG